MKHESDLEGSAIIIEICNETFEQSHSAHWMDFDHPTHMSNTVKVKQKKYTTESYFCQS